MTHTLRILATAVGFEPTELSPTGFQDQHLKPLGHTAMWLTVVDLNHRSMIPRIVFPQAHLVLLGTFIY